MSRIKWKPSPDSGLPPSLPLPASLQTYLFWRWPLQYLEFSRDRLGTPFTIFPVGRAPLVILSDPEEIRSVLNTPADILYPGEGAAVIQPIVGGRSFMLADEDIHLRGRRTVLPFFSENVLREHSERMSAAISKSVRSWPCARPITLHPYLRALSLRLILDLIFDSSDARVDKLHKAVFEMLTVTASLTLQEPQLRRLPGWRNIWQRFARDQQAAADLLEGLLADGMRDNGRVGALVSQPANGYEAGCDVFNLDQIRDDVMSVIVAGHETTASQLAWAIQLICRHPDVSSRLADEVDQGSECAYTTATIQEVQRHRPVFLFAIPRVVQDPITIGGRPYGPNVHLAACIYLLHHDRSIYEDPDEFRPERFLSSGPNVGSWLPWGGGRRRCPGRRLALNEMELVLQRVFAEFSVEPVGSRLEGARWRSVIVTPGRGSEVVLRRRSV